MVNGSKMYVVCVLIVNFLYACRIFKQKHVSGFVKSCMTKLQQYNCVSYIQTSSTINVFLLFLSSCNISAVVIHRYFFQTIIMFNNDK